MAMLAKFFKKGRPYKARIPAENDSFGEIFEGVAKEHKANIAGASTSWWRRKSSGLVAGQNCRTKL